MTSKGKQKMTNNQEISKLAAKRIAETLEILEFAGIPRKEIDLVRKAFWRFFDEMILNKKVSENDKSKSA